MGKQFLFRTVLATSLSAPFSSAHTMLGSYNVKHNLPTVLFNSYVMFSPRMMEFCVIEARRGRSQGVSVSAGTGFNKVR